MDVKAIVLDFDGVIVESNGIKHRAFEEIFKKFPDYYQEIIAYHLAHNAIDRHNKFRYIMTEIMKMEFDAKLAQTWATTFADLTREKIVNSRYVDGAPKFIEFFSKRYPLYVASATPLDELLIILKARGLAGYFKRVYGAPMTKSEMFAEIIRVEGIEASQVIFIGDSPEDYEAAKASGILFLTRISDHKMDPVNVRCFKDMDEVKYYLLEEGKANE